MYLEVHNTFTYVRDGDLPYHVLSMFHFNLKQELYQQRKLPNLPMKAKSIYFPQAKAFFTGALPMIMHKLSCKIVDKRRYPPDPFDKSKVKVPEWLRPKQRIAFESMLETERGIINHTTSTGKTYLASAWVKSIPLNHLVIVHRKEILSQFKKRIETDTGEEVDVLGAKNYSLGGRRILIGMIQSIAPYVLSNRLDINKYQSIIIDESHHLGWGSQYLQIMIFSEAFFRFGLTGTFKRDSGDTIVSFGILGPILHTYRYKDAVDDGYVTPVHIFMIQANWFMRHVSSEPYHNYYKQIIVENQIRNRMIVDASIVSLTSGKSTLILVNQLDHGEFLLDKIRERLVALGETREHASQWIDFVHGKDPEREQKREDFENGTIKCLIATTIYDEGIDIHRIACIIYAAGGRSERAVLQRVGRGQRLEASKKLLIVFDFTDEFSKLSKKHARERLKVYKNEGYSIQGFKPS